MTDALTVSFSSEVAQAKADGVPVVALESTIITHGMPYPGNLDMAESVEAIIRAEGAVPATIAVINGNLHIGLEPAELEALGQDDRRDEAVARRSGICDLRRPDRGHHRRRDNDRRSAGGNSCLRHRRYRRRSSPRRKRASISRPISKNWARTPVIVVCAGAKAILDVPKTLEVLETKGVPVVHARPG